MFNAIKVGNRQIDLSVPVCMGILNVTPDSFSDGSQLKQDASDRFIIDIDKALHLAERMVNDGAAIIDVGGESTRPGAAEVSIQEELDRVIPVIEVLAAKINASLSVDTSKAEVMIAAINAGAGLVNDIRSLANAGTLEIVAESQAAVCLVHMQGTPSSMQDACEYEDVVGEVFDFLKQKRDNCTSAGITNDKIIVDPGFGFGKSVEHNYQLLKNLAYFKALGQPILVGISRKSMIGNEVDKPANGRIAGTIAATEYALRAGANIVRTHDVAATMDAIKVHLQIDRVCSTRD
ncbi:MAG: dihydropteroate synthase [Gammaproteobacteria bacterium]|jgi:dihydropteroate synthase|nr:dihydropteroate synthase [Gammaproteobacteria bacterium]MDP6094565.1 dihydropteroate synthase [Gammaproteobacteria bacterium]MDP7455096.1 dihydropteroate synthase [Gammaproteobacteria bacterium]|tara:strand:+ start:3065 stop:3940 length:876 start_codon:yes stop_codon:yes gene_type:complete